MRTRAAASDFIKSFLPLGIEYHYDDNQLIKVNTLTGNKAQIAGPLPVTLLARVIMVGEMILVQTQT